MNPTLKVSVKSDRWLLAWCFAVTGADMNRCCLAALRGRHVPQLRWTRYDKPPPGHCITVPLGEYAQAPYLHLCAIGESYLANVHLCFCVSRDQAFVVENRYFRFEGQDLEELVIPNPDFAYWSSGLTWRSKMCRCIQAAYGLLPFRPSLPPFRAS